MKAMLMCAALGLGALGLSACDYKEDYAENRAKQLNVSNAQFYLRRCVEGLERTRVTAAAGGVLPAALDGEDCGSALLGDYKLNDTQLARIRESKIELDPARLSAYTLTITSLDGEQIVYRDRGVAAAKAEEAGTMVSSPATPEEQAEASEQIGEQEDPDAGIRDGQNQ